MSRAFVFPGQGAQAIGMGQALADAYPAAKAVFDEVDEALGESLSNLIWTGDIEELTLTQNAQPALMATSVAAAKALEAEGISVDQAAFVAGHSLGEYSALAAAGSLSVADAARLLRTRGQAMQEAVPVGVGAMAALLGLDALFTLFPWAYVAVKTLGALYLIWIAVQMWRSARTPIRESRSAAHSRFFRQGMLINLGNPKSVLFAAAVLPVIFPRDLTPADKALIFGNHLAVEWIIQPTLAILLSTETIRRRYLGAKTITDRLAAGVLGALGLRLLADR